MDQTIFQKILNQLYGPFTSHDAETKANLVAAEKRLGVRLPKVLRDNYLLAGLKESLNQVHNHLLSLEELVLEDKALVFYVENQADVLWAILQRDLAMTDPPVFRAENSEETLNWQLDHRFLSDFLITMACWQAVAGGLDYTGIAPIRPETAELIRQQWQSLPIGENAWGLSIYSREGQVLILLDDPEEGLTLMAAGKTEKDFASIDDCLHPNWQERYVPPEEETP